MNWQEVTVNINKSVGEAVANIMEELGAEGVVFTDKDNRIGITAYYPADNNFERLFSTLKSKTYSLSSYNLEPGEIELELNLTANEDWATSWHKFFKPITVGEKFVISPPWEDCSAGKRMVININPGMAFGTGDHESTRLCIQILENYLESNYKDINNMLDIGAGTGILSIIAAKLGLEDIYAIDISKAAIKASRKNIKINNVEKSVRIEQRDLEKGLEGSYSLVVANLLPDLILRLLPEMVKHLDDSGWLILSGIIETKKELIKLRVQETGLSVVGDYNQNEWSALICRKG